MPPKESKQNDAKIDPFDVSELPLLAYAIETLSISREKTNVGPPERIDA